MPPVPMTAMRFEASRESRFPLRKAYSTLVTRNNPEESMPAQPTSPAREAIRCTVPKLAEISDNIIYGEIWERPGLTKRDRSLIVVATLIALGRERQLVGHLNRALDNGVTKDEISEIITHLAFYAGWPAAMTAAAIAKDVFEKR
jgi:4-carboxymuconolactone decarboxylase